MYSRRVCVVVAQPGIKYQSLCVMPVAAAQPGIKYQSLCVMPVASAQPGIKYQSLCVMPVAAAQLCIKHRYLCAPPHQALIRIIITTQIPAYASHSYQPRDTLCTVQAPNKPSAFCKMAIPYGAIPWLQPLTACLMHWPRSR